MNGTSDPSPLIVVVLVDALGWEPVTEAAFLAGDLPHRRPLETVLGFSAGAIPALLSGTWPAENGHWVMFHRDPAKSPFRAARLLAHLPGRARRSWRLRQWVKRRAAAQIRGYFDLYEVPWEDLAELDVCERANLFAPGGLGSIRTIFDDAREQRLKTRVWDWRTDDDANETDFVKAVEAAAQGAPGAADFLFYYTPALDALMHRYGTRAAPVRARLARLADALGRALGRARALGRETWVYVLSDHGMTDVVEHVDVMGAIAKTGLRPGVDFHAFYDSTLARFWFRSPLAESAVREALAGLAGRFLEAEEEKRLGFWFADRRYGEAIWLLDEGRLIVPSYMGKAPVAGMHGYDPSVPSTRAIMLSNRPLPAALTHVVDFRAFFGAELEARRASSLRLAVGGIDA
jgi:hypothetical protein